MSVLVLADGSGGPVGVLVDDPVCGRVLLDCGTGVSTRAAFAGVSLAGARVLCSGTGPDLLDPAVPAAAVVDGLPGATVLDVGHRRRAVLLPTSAGVLLHHPAPWPLPPASVAALPRAVTPTLPLRHPLPGVDTRAPRTGRRVLVTGGARSGKSVLAESLLAGHAHVVYLATGPRPGGADVEWQQRVATHRDRRPAGWRTVEDPDAAAVLGTGSAPVLLDCVGTWLTAVMDAAGTWDGHGDADLALAVGRLLDAWCTTGRDVVAVTNEVGSGVVPATSAGRRFRDELGRLNARLAAAADEVVLCTAGVGQRLR